MLFIICLLFLEIISSKLVIFKGVPNDPSSNATWYNGRLFNFTLNQLKPNDTFVVPNMTFYTMGGIIARYLKHVTIRIDGTIIFSGSTQDVNDWPTDAQGNVFECFLFDYFVNVTFTSQTQGLLDGNGAVWWGVPFLGYAERGENRPRLFHIRNSQKILVEKLFFLNSPYWTFWANQIDQLGSFSLNLFFVFFF